jgi:hypothetical protein
MMRIRGGCFLGVKQQGREAGHSPPSDAEVKNCGAIPPFPRRYATSRKVAGSSPDEVIGFFSIDVILPAALWPWGRLSL